MAYESDDDSTEKILDPLEKYVYTFPHGEVCDESFDVKHISDLLKDVDFIKNFMKDDTCDAIFHDAKDPYVQLYYDVGLKGFDLMTKFYQKK